MDVPTPTRRLNVLVVDDNPDAAESLALLLRYSLGLEREARAIEVAVDDAIELGLRTPDIARGNDRVARTSDIGDAVAAAVQRELHGG